MQQASMGSGAYRSQDSTVTYWRGQLASSCSMCPPLCPPSQQTFPVQPLKWS